MVNDNFFIFEDGNIRVPVYGQVDAKVLKDGELQMVINENGVIVQRSKVPEIEKVIFSEPATIVKWKDGTKTVVKCGDGEIWDPEKGLAMAICKRSMGNKGNYNEVFKKWLDGRHCMTKTDIILEYQAEKAKRAEERRNGAKG